MCQGENFYRSWILGDPSMARRVRAEAGDSALGRPVKNETPKIAPRRQGARKTLPSPNSAHGDQAISAKCRGAAPF